MEKTKSLLVNTFKHVYEIFPNYSDEDIEELFEPRYVDISNCFKKRYKQKP